MHTELLLKAFQKH